MYSISDVFRRALRQNDKSYEWSGKITCKDGTVYNFGQVNLDKQNAGSITRMVCSGTGLELGSVCAAELDLQMWLQADRYQLYDAEISLTYTQHIGVTRTWSEAQNFTWNEMSATNWGDYPKIIRAQIPMGVFTISEVKRMADKLLIIAYDNMLKFEKNYRPDSVSRTAFDWLRLLCRASGVSLGMTRDQIRALPNGARSLAFADGVVEDCETCRDVLRYLAAVLCSVAQINRAGELVLIPYDTSVEETFPAAWRYSSEFSDFRSYYTGMYATYKAGGLSEYFHIDGEDDGLVYNLGVNPFLQISKDNVRKATVQTIIDQLSLIHYAPFKATVPCHPYLDPMDVIGFTGRQATGQDYGAITKIVYVINGKMDLESAGENPRLNSAKSRYTKNIEGLLSGDTYSGGNAGSSDFWMVYDDNSDAAQEIGETETVVCSLNLTLDADHSRSQNNFTATYTLDEAATVIAEVQDDEDTVFKVKQDQAAGNQTITVTCGKAWEGRSTREIRVLLSAIPASVAASQGETAPLESEAAPAEGEEEPVETVKPMHLDIHDARLTVFGYGWNDEVVDSGDGLTDQGETIQDIAEDLGYDTGEDVDWDDIADQLDDDLFDDGIYIDEDGNIYTDEDGDGIYTDEDGNEFDGDGDFYLPEEDYDQIADLLSDLADMDEEIAPYAVDEDAIGSCGYYTVSGKLDGDQWPHFFLPGVYAFSIGSTACIFNRTTFKHRTSLETEFAPPAYHSYAHHGGAAQPVYTDTCMGLADVGPCGYPGGDPAYYAWQVLYGSFKKNMIIDPGDAGDKSHVERVEIDGRYYFKAKQADRL